MRDGNAIEVNNITKAFKVYLDRSNNFKDFLIHATRRRFENRQVLRGVSFEVKKGEAIGLIGHNGCGKSTTLKLLTRIMYPDTGTIEMDGRVSSLIELGAGFHPDMSGRENIYINASIFGLSRKEIEAREQSIIDFSELHDFIDNPVRTYSSGMYMRLAFAVAINVDADILLIDEILAVGDIAFQAKCFSKLKEIKKTGTTIVIVSHSLGQIEEICDKTYWIHEGVVKLSGDPHVVHPYYLQYMEQKSKIGKNDDSLIGDVASLSETMSLQALENDDMGALQKNMSALAREIEGMKWRDINRDCREIEKGDDIVSCSVCGYQAKRDTYTKKVSECAYRGGQLERYVCPECEAVFGPTKMFSLGEEGIMDEARIHYSAHIGKDTTQSEIRAFEALKPEKDKKYLAFGVTKFSNTVRILRTEGYDVYGYDLYETATEDPFVITDKKELEAYRFDGIFAGDILEQSVNPVATLAYMKKLTSTPNALIAIATPCFSYADEKSRHHLQFFTGKSADIMAQKVNMKIAQRYDELDDKGFICCVFEQLDEKHSYMEVAHLGEKAKRVGDTIVLTKGDLCYGPYIPLSGGDYKLLVEIETTQEQVHFRCTANKGEKLISTTALHSGENLIELFFSESLSNVEFLVTNDLDEEIVVKEVALLKTANK